MNPAHNTHIKVLMSLGMSLLLVSSNGLAKGQGEGKGGRRGDRERPGREGKAGEQGPGHEERVAFHKAQREKIQAHRKSLRQASESMRKAIRAEEDAYKAVAMLKESRVKCNGERIAFSEGIEAEALAFMEASFSKYEVPEADQAKIRDRAAKRTAKRKAMHEKHYAASIAALDALSAKEDLKKEDIKTALAGKHRGRGEGGGKHRRGKRKRKADGNAEVAPTP